MIDLHMHTYYSDGRFSPVDVIAAAAACGLRAIAICDHDTIQGSLEAQQAAANLGVELVPGIEITTRWPGVDLPAVDANVDLLGYNIDLHDAVFTSYTRALMNDMVERIDWCCHRLSQQGFPLALEDVVAENPRYPGLFHLIDALHHKGYASDWENGLRLASLVWQKVRETPFTIQAAIEQVHLAGGIAVLAHPCIVRPRGGRIRIEDMRRLVDTGLDGIEVYHWRMQADDRAYFLDLARHFDLLVTAGSDTHGWRHGLLELGSQSLGTRADEDMLAQLRARRPRSA